MKNLWNKIRISNRSGSHIGCVRVFPNNTLSHEIHKTKIVHLLMNKKYKCMTEVIFETGGRADIVAIKDGYGYIIEIVESETEKSLAQKKEKYPSEFTFIPVKTSDITSDLDIL